MSDRERFNLFIQAADQDGAELMLKHAILDFEASGASEIDVDWFGFVDEPVPGFAVKGSAVRRPVTP